MRLFTRSLTTTPVLAILLFNLPSQSFAQANIAPLATFSSAPGCSTGPCSTFNDLNFGTCGTQQVWISGGNGLPAGQVWIMAEWSSPKTVKEFIIHHAQDNTRHLCGGLIQVWQGGAWANHHTFSNLPLQCINSVAFPTVTTDKIRITAFVHCGSQLSNANFREIEIIENPIFHNDAGITNIPNPGIPVCNTLSDSLEIEIKNFGLANLDSVMVGLMVNDTVVGPFSVKTGGIAQNSTAIATLKFFRNLALGDTITTWTFQPNGVPDTNFLNDSISFVLIGGISGDYTVGPGMDFRTLDSAIQVLNQRGVCTPVTFRLYDTVHVYRGTIHKFFGSSSSRLVRFVSASGDPTKCSIEYNSTSGGNNHVLTLNGPSYLRFDSLTIRNNSTGSNSGVILFTGHVSDITFNNCILESAHTGTSSSAVVISSAATSLDHNIRIQNSMVNGGAWGTHMTGGSNFSGGVGLSVTNTDFNNQSLGALYTRHIHTVVFSHNSITSNSSNTGATALTIGNAKRQLEINYNEILSTTNWPANGMIIYGSNGRLNNPIWIYNNTIKLADTASTGKFRGIFLDTIGFANIAHNTIVIEGTHLESACLSVDNSGGCKVQNNILVNFGGGKSLEYKGVGSILVSDNNNLYASGAVLATYATSDEPDLMTWQQGSGFDMNSVSSNPGFNSRTDLHPCGSQTDNAGTPITYVYDDIDGVFRDLVHPDPGAYEFASPAKFSIGGPFGICNGDTFSITPSVSVNDLLIWNNTDTGFTFTTAQSGTYTAENINQCGLGRDTFTVAINQLVTLPVDTNICYGDTLHLTSNVSGSILWNNGSIQNSLSVGSAGRYSVEVVDADGCYSADTIYVTRSLAVNLPADTTICEGISIKLDPQTGAGNYNWNTGSTASIIFVDSTAVYSLSFTDVLSCSSMGSTRVTVTPKPSKGFTFKQHQSNLHFKATDTTSTTYHWSFGDGKSQTGPFRTVHVYPGNGSYKVTLTVTNSCGTVISDSTFEIRSIGMREQENPTLLVYPNPTRNNLTIDAKQQKVKSISVKNLLGVTAIIIRPEETSLIDININHLPVGTYILEVTLNSGQIIKNQIRKQ